MPAAILKTFGKTPKSLINAMDSFNINDPATKKKLHTIRVTLAESKKLENCPHLKKDQSTAGILYEAAVFTAPDLVKKTINMDNKAEQQPAANQWRHMTKHRVVFSRIHAYATANAGLLKQPFEIAAATVCAPNFMGSSPSDENEFLTADKSKLKQPAQYKDAMKLMFKRALTALDQSGAKIAAMPYVGGGIYLQSLSELGKAQAVEQINIALKEALEESQFSHIQEVVLTLPDTNTSLDVRSEQYQAAVKSFASYKGHTQLTVANVDALEVARVASLQGLMPGIVNAGSDRTIGGYWEKTCKSDYDYQKKSVPFEENLCNMTTTAYIHSSNNPGLLDNAKIKPFTANLCYKQTVTTTTTQTPNSTYSSNGLIKSFSNLSMNSPLNKPSGTFTLANSSKDALSEPKEVAVMIKQAVPDLTNTIWILDSKDNKNKIISFKTEAEAKKFAAKLEADYGIGSIQNQGAAKSPQKIIHDNKAYYGIFVTNEQYRQLVLKLKSTASNSKPSLSALFSSFTPQRFSVPAPKEVAVMIKQAVPGLANTIWILDSKDNKNKIISFKTEAEAKIFAAKLKEDYGIGSIQNQGAAKSPQKIIHDNKAYYGIFVTNEQYTALTEKIIKSSAQNLATYKNLRR